MERYDIELKHLNYIERNLQTSSQQHKIGNYSAKEDIVSYLFVYEYERNLLKGSYNSTEVMTHVDTILSNKLKELTEKAKFDKVEKLNISFNNGKLKFEFSSPEFTKFMVR